MNTLRATVIDVISSEHMSNLTVSIGTCTLNLLLAESLQKDTILHQSVTLAFKETEIILSKEMPSTTANCASATVQTIEYGTILTHVSLNFNQTTLTAIVPTITFHSLGIHSGDDVIWMIQPSEISLLRETRGH